MHFSKPYFSSGILACFSPPAFCCQRIRVEGATVSSLLSRVTANAGNRITGSYGGARILLSINTQLITTLNWSGTSRKDCVQTATESLFLPQ